MGPPHADLFKNQKAPAESTAARSGTVTASQVLGEYAFSFSARVIDSTRSGNDGSTTGTLMGAKKHFGARASNQSAGKSYSHRGLLRFDLGSVGVHRGS